MAKDPVQNGLTKREEAAWVFEPAYTKKEDIKAYYDNPVQQQSGVAPSRVFKLQ